MVSSRAGSSDISSMERCRPGAKRRARLVRNFSTRSGDALRRAGFCARSDIRQPPPAEASRRKADNDAIRDRAFVGIVIVARELHVLDAFHPGAQYVDTRIAGDVVFVVIPGGQAAEDQRHGDHILDAMVAVGGIGERSGFVDDAHGRFMGADGDGGNIFYAPPIAVICRCRSWPLPPPSGRGIPQGMKS